MRTLISLFVILAFAGGFGALIFAQDTSADEEAVNMIAQKWAEAWNTGDMKAVAGLYTTDADYIGFTGEAVKSREEIEKTFTEMSSAAFKGAKISIQEPSIRFIKPDLAITDNTWEITDLPETEGEPPPASGLSTTVSVKQDGQWLIAVHRTRVPPAPPSTSQE